jgi:hypothetical protein
VTEVFALTLMVLIVKLALVWPTGTVTDAGTTAAELLLVNVTTLAAVAGALSVTVPEAEVPPTTVAGFTATALRAGAGGWTVNVTGTTLGDPVATLEVVVTWPVYVPALMPVVETLTCRLAGELPLVGLTVSHAASEAAVKLNVPAPLLLTLSDAGAGAAPPAVAVKVMADGVTARIGPLIEEPYADSGLFEYTVPVAQVAGSVANVVWALVSDEPPEAVSRKRRVPDPTGPSTVIQYTLPDTTDALGMSTVFQAPATGELKLACVNNAPGCVPLFEYNPTVSVVAVEVGSTYTVIEPIDPDASAVVLNASATPPVTLSWFVLTVWSPSRTVVPPPPCEAATVSVTSVTRGDPLAAALIVTWPV